jgi:hypothetical protein
MEFVNTRPTSPRLMAIGLTGRLGLSVPGPVGMGCSSGRDSVTIQGTCTCRPSLMTRNSYQIVIPVKVFWDDVITTVCECGTLAFALLLYHPVTVCHKIYTSIVT